MNDPTRPRLSRTRVVRIETPPSPEADRPRDLIDALRASTKGRRSAAAGELYAELVAHAAGAAGRGRGAELQPESVALSVLAGEFDRAVSVCEDDEHLRRRLKRAVRNKIIDRQRKKKPGQLPVDEDGRPMEPGTDPDGAGADLATTVAPGPVAGVAYEAWRETVLGAAEGAGQRDLVESYVFETGSWPATAERLGIRPNAARTRMSRVRPSLLDAAVPPLLGLLGAEGRTLFQRLLIDGVDASAAGAEMGAGPRETDGLILSHLVGPLAASIGVGGVLAVCRVVGRQLPASVDALLEA